MRQDEGRQAGATFTLAAAAFFLFFSLQFLLVEILYFEKGPLVFSFIQHTQYIRTVRDLDNFEQNKWVGGGGESKEEKIIRLNKPRELYRVPPPFSSLARSQVDCCSLASLSCSC